MQALKDLKLTNAKRNMSVSAVQHRRNKLSKKLLEQVELLNAELEGRTYMRKGFKTIKDEHDVRKTVEVEQALKKWFWTLADGRAAIQLRYGSKVVALNAKGATTVEADTKADLLKAMQVLARSVDGGDLDAAIENASKKLREAFVK